MTSRPTEFQTISDAVNLLRERQITPEIRHVCWVSDEMVGLFKNGGGGTVVSGFCEALIAAGHKVSVLYTSQVDRDVPDNNRVVQQWRARGLELIFLSDVWSYRDDLLARSHAVHDWLQSKSFDIVHFHDFNGSGFAACAAKRMGLAYENTLLCVSNFGTARWGWECMELYLQSPNELQRDWLETKALENADVVFCQSQYMANWLTRNNYKLPDATYVQPSIMPSTHSGEGPSGRLNNPIQEIVFYGRHEVRKGLRVFIAAAEHLSRQRPDLRFTFSGKFGEVDNEHSGGYILSRLAAIPNDITFLAHLSRDQAIAQIKGADILAVMPSIDDNFPGAVFEAVLEGVEFIASNRGGIPEIVHPDNHGERLFEPTVHGLTSAIERVIEKRPPRPKLAFDPAANIAAWMDWHCLVSITPMCDTAKLPDPIVSICLLHYDRPKLLAMAIEGLRLQTYSNFEVVLVDDGSTEPEAIAYLTSLENASLPFSLKIIRTADIRLGAARNIGVNEASGEYVIFVDDDNIPRPKMIETLLRAAQRRNLDVGTCLAYLLDGEGAPNDEEDPTIGYYPAGGPISQGLIQNVFGDANAIVKRSTFLSLGGFDPTPGIGAEDWDLFARIVLAGGRLEAVPAPLYWYRRHSQQLTTRWHSTHLYQERILKTYWAAFEGRRPAEFLDALRLFMGRHVQENLKTAAWFNLGARTYGEYERALLPHVGNVQASYNALCALCLKMGRFRDAARLLLNSDNPHGHLLELGDQVGQLYAQGRTVFAQGYYGDTGACEKMVSILPAMIAQVRCTASNVQTLPYKTVKFQPERNSILVHPIIGQTSIAVIDDAFPPNNRILTAKIEVDNHQGPEVRFTVMLVDAEIGVSLQDGTLPSRYHATTSAVVGPSDGSHRLTLQLDQPHKEPLTIILATDVIDRVDFAWATFSRIQVGL